MRFAPAVLVTLLLGLCLAITSEAAGDLSRDVERLEQLRETVNVDADRIEYAEGVRKILASGNVRVILGTRSLFADEVSVDLDDQVLIASGGVILMEGMNRLEGDRIEYNYRTNLGVITNGRATLDSGVSFSGVEIRREGERQYSVRDARFSSCRAVPARAGDPGCGVSVRRGDRVPKRNDHHAPHLASGSRASPPCTPPSSRCPSVSAGRDSSFRVSVTAATTASGSGSRSSGPLIAPRMPPLPRSIAPSAASSWTESIATSWTSAPGGSFGGTTITISCPGARPRIAGTRPGSTTRS